jgi:hypothetical protein
MHRSIRFLRRSVTFALGAWALLDCSAAIHSRRPTSPVVIDPSVPAPAIAFDQMSFDFGKIPPEQTVVHNYVLLNTGKATLHLIDVKAVCGCTSTLVGKKDLDPGESTIIQAAYTPEKGFSGAVRKTIMVISNDPAHSTLTLRFAADVLPAASSSTPPAR